MVVNQNIDIKIRTASETFDRIEDEMLEQAADNLAALVNSPLSSREVFYDVPVKKQKPKIKDHLTHRPFVHPELARLREELSK